MKTFSCLLVLASFFLTSCRYKDDNKTPVEETPIDKSLVLYLPLDGDVLDASSYSNTGIIDSATFTLDRNGKANHASLFDSVQTYIRIPNSTVLDTITNVTLSAWIQPESWAGTGNNSIIDKPLLSPSSTLSIAPYYQYHLGITGNKYGHYFGTVAFSLSIDDQYVYSITEDNAWTPGQWWHVVGTYDGSDIKIYLNGELKNTVHAPGKMGHFSRDVFIGKRGSYTLKPSNTPGVFDEIRIYSRALSADEIHTLYLQK